MVDIPAQGDLPVVEVLEGRVAQQLECHPVGLRARVVDEGCDSPGLESECKLMGSNPNTNGSVFREQKVVNTYLETK